MTIAPENNIANQMILPVSTALFCYLFVKYNHQQKKKPGKAAPRVVPVITHPTTLWHNHWPQRNDRGYNAGKYI